MSRVPTFQPNYDDLRRLSLVDLKQKESLIEVLNSRLNHIFDTSVTTNIQVKVQFDFPKPAEGYLELSYYYKKSYVHSYFDLTQVASNLGKPGGIWYIICPVTQKRCRILYSNGKRFVSRHALGNTLYDSQTSSKSYRSIVSLLKPSIELDKACSEFYKRYSKRHYRGKLTPKARRVLKWEHLDDMATKILNKQSL